MLYPVRILTLIALSVSPLASYAQDTIKQAQARPVATMPAPALTAPPVMPTNPFSPVPPTAAASDPARQEVVLPPFAETLPIEINLMYLKLSKKEPNFDFLVFANPSFRQTEQRVSDSDNIKKERDALQAMFESFTPNTVFYAEKNINLDAYFANNNTIKTEGIEPYDPILYPVTPTDVYGIFIRNARDTLRLRPPFEYGTPSSLMMVEEDKLKDLPAEMTLKPLAADIEPYYTEDNKPIKVIVADIVEIKIYKDKEKTTLLLQKRFKNWKPVVEDKKFKTDDLVQPATP